MSAIRTGARVRKQLLAKGFTKLPRCPLCGSEQAVSTFAAHTRTCERDCASETIQAIDKRLAEIHATEPRGPEHKACLETEEEWLRQERSEAYNVIFGLNEFGQGRCVVEGPLWPEDGMAF